MNIIEAIPTPSKASLATLQADQALIDKTHKLLVINLGYLHYTLVLMYFTMGIVLAMSTYYVCFQSALDSDIMYFFVIISVISLGVTLLLMLCGRNLAKRLREKFDLLQAKVMIETEPLIFNHLTSGATVQYAMLKPTSHWRKLAYANSTNALNATAGKLSQRFASKYNSPVKALTRATKENAQEISASPYGHLPDYSGVFYLKTSTGAIVTIYAAPLRAHSLSLPIGYF